MRFFKTSLQITDSDLNQVEQDLKIKMPTEFRQHYLEDNGGVPEARYFSWPDNTFTHINSFSSIKYEGFGSLEKVYNDLVLLENYIPLGILPFAADDGGNLFCISCRNEDFGFIYYWNHDEIFPECMVYLCKSFNLFIDNLKLTDIA